VLTIDVHYRICVAPVLESPLHIFFVLMFLRGSGLYRRQRAGALRRSGQAGLGPQSGSRNPGTLALIIEMIRYGQEDGYVHSYIKSLSLTLTPG